MMGHNLASGNLWPNLTLLLDLPVEVARARRQGQSDRMEALGDGFQQKLRDGYLALARGNSGRIKVLDAAVSSDVLAGQVLGMIEIQPGFKGNEKN